MENSDHDLLIRIDSRLANNDATVANLSKNYADLTQTVIKLSEVASELKESQKSLIQAQETYNKNQTEFTLKNVKFESRLEAMRVQVEKIESSQLNKRKVSAQVIAAVVTSGLAAIASIVCAIIAAVL